MSEPASPTGPSGPRWSCLLDVVGSREPLDYVLSPAELRRYGFPSVADEGRGYRALGPAPAGPLVSHRPRVFALDCEMVRTERGTEVARVSVVARVAEVAGALVRWPPPEDTTIPAHAWRPRVLFDGLVQPEAPVLDYLTEFSGLTAEMLATATLSLEQVYRQLRGLIRVSDILCGHSLDNDLHGLLLHHARVIDTGVLYPHHDEPPARHALDVLCRQHLGRSVQVDGHSSVEDATAALELAQRHIDGGGGRLSWAPIPSEVPSVFHTLELATALHHLRLPAAQVRCAYLRGSRSVGYAGVRDDGSLSDWDLVLVTAAADREQDDVHIHHGNIEAVLYDERAFRRLIENCCIWALECIFAEPVNIWKEELDFRHEFADFRQRIPVDLFHERLRRSVRYQSGTQWAKARRYLEKRGDRYSCRKRIFIALRFLVYGLEVARTGAIADLRCANHLWDEQLADDPSTTWAQFRAGYESTYKRLQEEFRESTPKRPRYGGFRRHLGTGQDRQPRLPELDERIPTARDGRVNGGSGASELEQPELAVVGYLRSVGGDTRSALARLQSEFRIGVRVHEAHPSVVQLRYTPASTPRDHPIVVQCRGLILDSSRDWQVLAYPFDRFFNLGEPEAATVDICWERAHLQDKLDGSLAILYWWRGSWRVASSRRPDATGLLGLRNPDGGIPLHEMFWDIWQRQELTLPPSPEVSGQHRCYLFEVTSSRHAIIVRYRDDRVTLIGARDLTTFQEISAHEIARVHGWPSVATRPLPVAAVDARTNVATDDLPRAHWHRWLQAQASALDASLQEGFIVCDEQFRRLKVKSPDYLRKAWMFPLCPTRAHINDRRLLQVLLAGEGREFAVYCPQYKGEFDAVERRYDQLCQHIEAVYATIEAIASQKAFAARAKEHAFHGALFLMRRDRCSARDALGRLTFKKLEKLVFGRPPRNGPSRAA